MITTEELAGRKQMRKTLEAKRSLLEEAVERSLCEGMYDRIYRHKSTQDEAMDDKLRSKTAALDLVGIGPADLGVDLGEGPEPTAEAIANKTSELAQMLEGARKDVVHMHESKYPLGKLNRLKAAHRSIVDALAHFHPSASADEIMPMLIFTLITLPPENLNVISDINFIQSFRWEPKLTGEAAYCLTNLEAAISFLQTVDLATLRSDELPSGPPKSTSPKTETFPPAYASASGSGAETAKDTVSGSKPAASTNQQKTPTPLRHRRLSDLVNTPAQAFGAASDAVFTTADQSLKNISNSLGDSYKFLLGKLRERQDSPRESIDVPRTLADARKLVGTPPPEEEGNASGTSSLFGGDEDGKRLSVREDRMLNLIGGRRDRSADSAVSGRSAGSSKPGPAAAGSGQSNPPVLDQMRNLGNSFNPMARLQSMSVMRGFTRNVSQPTPPPATETKAPADGGDLASVSLFLPPSPPPPLLYLYKKHCRLISLSFLPPSGLPGHCRRLAAQAQDCAPEQAFHGAAEPGRPQDQRGPGAAPGLPPPGGRAQGHGRVYQVMDRILGHPLSPLAGPRWKVKENEGKKKRNHHRIKL